MIAPDGQGPDLPQRESQPRHRAASRRALEFRLERRVHEAGRPPADAAGRVREPCPAAGDERARAHAPAISISMRSLNCGGGDGGDSDRPAPRPGDSNPAAQFRASNWGLSNAKRRIGEALPADQMAVNPQRTREPLCSSVRRAKPVHLLNSLASEFKNQVGTGIIGPEPDRPGHDTGKDRCVGAR